MVFQVFTPIQSTCSSLNVLKEWKEFLLYWYADEDPYTMWMYVKAIEPPGHFAARLAEILLKD
ncbi:hypothetical protein [Planomicrobium sp. CPCC 101079]|uniref:hypothetical protein n=1 Tax=Planomicrobium sp. CPCC 101079 TaxID=2599618 RepID=UPI0011B46E8D|nr:hypothetical protein [Planomicrobium sp. CPCC 101079]TWT00940.1 hypothetical protein FQV28_16240 [Planomicrobium sp. CPCC 101079]